MHAIFFKGLLIGFVIAVPVGPTGLLCINRSLYGGTSYGLLSWLGVATGDALAGGIAALGLTLVSDFLFDQHGWLHVMVGLFFCYFGFRIFTARRARPVAVVRETKLLRGYTSTLFLTVTNPITFASFIGIYAGWGVKIIKGEYFSAVLLAVAVFIGTGLWWLILGATLSFCRKRFSDSVMRGIDLVSGAVMMGFGFVLLIGL
jgi:threonine/homoserine/homoserine lactone efflux protein